VASLAAEGIQAYLQNQAMKRDASRELAAPQPEAVGPSAEEMAANPTLPPTRIVRPPPVENRLLRAQQLLKQGLISPEAYDAFAKQMMPFPSNEGRE
jgi:hypothetical protein